MASSYKAYMRLLKKWPIDKTKRDRDLGRYLRDNVKSFFVQGEITPVDEVDCLKKISALERLSANTYFLKYKRENNSSSTGLTSEQCSQVLSSDFLEYLENEDKGFISKLIPEVKPAEAKPAEA
ncbi:ubiquinol-cytochrome-c reductase complex assembly factor 2-like [Ctenocephalides felis]|uniref:ubiquinol-cytochrome-c reductase complex assembly factor 2-like n=1 Tax=Ctenocephalides felis TaxID=7515 RepID=UPI000E6E41EA|nr:ubiquinol-cytochrome-c reductase complex assembly factor 2-like [Ctenocephalides felis]